MTLADAVLHLPQATWSANGARVIGIGGGKAPSLAVGKSSRTKLDWKMGPGQLKLPVTAKREYYTLGVASLPDDEVLAAWASIGHGRTTGLLKLVRVGLKKDQVSTLPTAINVQSKSSGRMAVSADGRWLAVTTNPAFRVVLYDLKNKREVGHLGPTTRVPRAVAWTQTRKGYGIAWGYQARLDSNNGKAELNEGLDMGQLEPLSLEALAAAQVGARLGKRSISISDKGKIHLIHGGKKVLTHHLRDVLPKTARLYKDKAGVERLIVAHGAGGRLSIVDFDTGKIITAIGGNYSRIYDVSVSPDQKYVLVAGGGMELQVFALADPKKPLLRLAPGWRGKASAKENELAQPQKPLRQTTKPGGDWVAWTAQGYYAGTPGGEKLFGWKVVSAPDRLAAFLPASRFRKQLYRPELIKQVLAKGSVEAALKHLGQETAAPLEDLLPPTVAIESMDTSKLPTVTIKVKAKGSGPKQPVMSMRLLLNGRPLPEGKYEVDLGKDGKAEYSRSWTLDVPEGKYELSVLARGPDSLGVSAGKEVSFKKPPDSRLFALCVGVSKYAEPKFKLEAAGNDATAIAAALKKHCGKPLFASADADLLLDDKATKKGVLDALAAMRPQTGRQADQAERPGGAVLRRARAQGWQELLPVAAQRRPEGPGEDLHQRRGFGQGAVAVSLPGAAAAGRLPLRGRGGGADGVSPGDGRRDADDDGRRGGGGGAGRGDGPRARPGEGQPRLLRPRPGRGHRTQAGRALQLPRQARLRASPVLVRL